jgi:Ca-activated chloride channel family protein
MPDWIVDLPSVVNGLADAVARDLHFLRPLWLLALPLCLWVPWYWHRRARAGSGWAGRIDPTLLDALLEPARPGPARFLPMLLGLSLAAALIGIAGPAWDRLPQPVEQRTDAVVIVLDLSLSMLAEDVRPSRLSRARQKIADLLAARREGSTALLVYAGNAHVVVPLTTDVRTMEHLLPVLHPAMMPVFGSDLGAALDLATELLSNAGHTQGQIIVLTDGIDRDADVTTREDPRIPVSILGIGTEAGATIPLDFSRQPGQVLRTQQGEPILARLDTARLEAVARAMHGRYRDISIDNDDVTALLDTPLPSASSQRMTDRVFDLWADQGYWFAILLLPFLLLGFRRGVLVLWPLAALPALLAPVDAQASLWDDLWQRPDQQAWQQLRAGEPGLAAPLFEHPDWRATALYRAGEYDHAAALWGETSAQADTSDAEAAATAISAIANSHYNRGNALAHTGDYEGAISAYDAALALAPTDEDAAFNRDLMRKLKDRQDAEKESEPKDQRGSEGEESSNPNGGNNNAAPGQEQAETSEDKPGDPAEAESTPGQPSGEEREAELADQPMSPDALEQWLRRVPDDPGGLLRRKFQHETNQRLRRGEYRAPDPEKIW